MLFGLGLIAGTAAPAQAVTWYTWDPAGCGTFFTSPCYLLYTGTYPGGLVKALGGLNEYQVSLQSATADYGPWVTVATTYPQTSRNSATAAWHVGKVSYYRACIKTISGGPYWCGAALYLGS